jgi:uncharacterized protein YacL
MSEQTPFKEQFVKVLVDAPGHLLGYVLGLIVAVLDDYTLITLVIACALLGFVTSILIACTAFFGAYFVLRLVANLADVVSYHARTTAQATMQVAGATAQLGNHIGNARVGQDVLGEEVLP